MSEFVGFADLIEVVEGGDPLGRVPGEINDGPLAALDDAYLAFITD